MMGIKIDFDIESTKKYVDDLKNTLNSMKHIQKEINSHMLTFHDSFVTNGSKKVFENLEDFLSTEKNSTLSGILRNIETNTEQLDQVIISLNRINDLGN